MARIENRWPKGKANLANLFKIRQIKLKKFTIMATKKMACAAKKSARIVTMTAAMAASMHLSADDANAMQCAFADMAEEYGQSAIIMDINPFDGLIA